MHVMVHKTPSLRWLTSTGWVASYLTNAKRGVLVSGMLLRWELYSFQSLSYLLRGDNPLPLQLLFIGPVGAEMNVFIDVLVGGGFC